MFIHKLLNKCPDVFPEEAPLILLDSKYDVYMAKNGKDTKKTRNISKILHLVRNG